MKNKGKRASRGTEMSLVLRNKKHFYIRYAITQAVVCNSVLLMWYWCVCPELSATLLLAFELCYFRIIHKYNFLPFNFSSFGQGIIVTSLLGLIVLSTLPWYATSQYGCSFLDFYIYPVEGSFISLLVAAVSGTFFLYLFFLNLFTGHKVDILFKFDSAFNGFTLSSILAILSNIVLILVWMFMLREVDMDEIEEFLFQTFFIVYLLGSSVAMLLASGCEARDYSNKILCYHQGLPWYRYPNQTICLSYKILPFLKGVLLQVVLLVFVYAVSLGIRLLLPEVDYSSLGYPYEYFLERQQESSAYPFYLRWLY